MLKQMIKTGCLLTLLSAVAGVTHAQMSEIAQQCYFEQIEFRSNFPMGRLDGCEQHDEYSYTLHIHPENIPINPSPWYAFQVINHHDRGQSIDITLVSHSGPARYSPRASMNRKDWSALTYTRDAERMQFSVDVQPDSPLWISGQEIIDNVAYIRWLSELAQTEQQEIRTLGRGTQGRSLNALIHSAKQESDDWLVIIGRQHPPEITGAFALLDFANALFSDSEIFAALRQSFNILLVPNMNPDGVHAGNWRHTPTGLDMNRDWLQRTQPETQALHQVLQEIDADGGRIRFALDFHSTRHNVYYTMPADYVNVQGQELLTPQLVENWLRELDSAIPHDVLEQPGYNREQGVFKQYIADEYGAHAVTYEVGDYTERAEIRDTAQKAAELLSALLTGQL